MGQSGPRLECLNLVHDAGHQASGDGATTLTDVETLASLSSNGAKGLEDHFDVVTGHHTLGLVLTGEAQVGGFICEKIIY